MHRRLSHPTTPIIHRVISSFNLPCHVKSNKEYVCDACQQAKSHQLPYPKSSSVSSHPLELVFSDVCGPAPSFVGRYKYYVSFIDDFSKFTWIYLLKISLKFSKSFMNFILLLNAPLIEKLLLCKLTGAVNMKNSSPFSLR